MLLSTPFKSLDGRHAGVLRVRNLSAGGLMADRAPDLPVGIEVEVVLRGIGDVSGAVTWTRRGQVGIMFSGSIDPRRARKPVGGVKLER